MVRPDREIALRGLVEVDETLRRGVHRRHGRLRPDKIPVMIAAEHLDHNRFGRIRLAARRRPRRLALVEFSQHVIAPGSHDPHRRRRR